MSLDFIGENANERRRREGALALGQRDDDKNAVLRGPNGIGKTMIAQNIAHQAVIQEHTAIFTSAGAGGRLFLVKKKRC